MLRRKFIKQSVALAGLGAIACGKKTRTIKGSITGASSQVGHLLRDKQFEEPPVAEQKTVVIIGGGVSGLSAAYHLQKKGIHDLVVLDLEEKMGGNAAYGQNEVSAFPMGAHYIPTPNNALTEYIDFLKDCGAVTGFNQEGLPVYNDYFLCFDPHERLYINGRWQEGLVPDYGVPENDKKQISEFLKLMNKYRYAKGNDGKEAFAIPIESSSADDEFTALDKLTFKQWMIENGFTSGYLHWYVNYCTRDDYGTKYDEVSAWAGIHYFASRKGRGANAEPYDVLTWPEGNGWLIKQLEKNLHGLLWKRCLAVKVKQNADGVLVDFFDVQNNVLRRIKCKQCVAAVPQFITARLLNDDERMLKVHQHFHYTPWMVANLKVKGLDERSGAPVSWDNVVYGAESLGYVDDTHQQLQQLKARRNLTFYLPLTAFTPLEERKKALEKKHGEWVAGIMNELKKVHPNIEEATEEININIWGHAMAKPLPGMVHGSIRKELSASINNNLHFAHTDLAGISIFEEAFYQGLHAANKVAAQIL